MKKILSLVSVLFTLSCIICSAQMSDNAVINYIRSGMSSGKTQSQIANELMAKGVTVSQARRLMDKYKSSASEDLNGVSTSNQKSSTTKNVNSSLRSRKGLNDMDTLKVRSGLDDSFDPSKQKGRDLVNKTDGTRTEEDDEEEEMLSVERLKHNPIFGHKIFRNPKLSFEPNDNAATPESYIIGPGDELNVEVWGINEASLSYTVSPEGRIIINQVGPVQVSGLTLAQATAKIRKALSSKYSLSGANSQSKLSVTLGKIRTIQVNILGEVAVPGTYRLSSISNVFNALYRAGGVTNIGSLRNVQVVRAGKAVAIADIYNFLFDGSPECNVSLCDGDAIIVPPYSALVEIKGGVKRPMLYEIREGEAIDKLLLYSGGLTFDASADEVCVERADATTRKAVNVKSPDFASYVLADGDVVTVYVNTQKDVFSNRVQIKGSVMRPGAYAIGGEIATVRQLVEHAGGLLEDAFTNRAQIIREKEDRSKMIVPLMLGDIMEGKADDVALRKGDVVLIANVNEICLKGDVAISGYVVNPGNYEYADGMTLEDIILIAGGLEPGASSLKVDVSRRIVNPDASSPQDTVSRVMSFSIDNSLSGMSEFTLLPYDVVAVRKSPTYNEQKKVRLSGEIAYPGEYSLVTNSDRLSDLFKRAGGATPSAYVAGTMLKRRVSEDERNVRRNLVRAVKSGSVGRTKNDSTVIDKMRMSETYFVGINMEKAIANPGSSQDVILHDGDEIIIPLKTNTVRVQGEILYPNAVNYIPGKKLKYYVDQSGGYSTDAKRHKVYVVHMNGSVSVGRNSKMYPGDEVVVPSKPERRQMTVGEWMSIGTAAASITTMITTLTTLLRK